MLFYLYKCMPCTYIFIYRCNCVSNRRSTNALKKWVELAVVRGYIGNMFVHRKTTKSFENSLPHPLTLCERLVGVKSSVIRENASN